MSNIPLSYLPGVCKSDSAYSNSMKSAYVNGRQATGRFTDMQWVRFVAGFPEKIIPTVGDIFSFAFTPLGIRAIRDWRTNAAAIYQALGCDTTLQVSLGTSLGGTTSDITPLRYRTSGTSTNAIVVTSNSTTVSIINTGDYATGEWVYLANSGTIGGVTLGTAYYNITGINTNVSFNVTATQTANVNGTGGGGLGFQFPQIKLTNPFVTIPAVGGTSLVTVTDTAHGAGVGDMIYWAQGTSVGGLNLTAGTAQVNAVLGANSYNFIFGGTGTAVGTATGGGTPRFKYGITFQSSVALGYPSPGMWQLEQYGQQLLVSAPGTSVYIYDPSVGGRAYPLLGAPANQWGGVVVTPERFIFVLGNNTNALTNTAMTVVWPDQSVNTQWASLPTNTANSGRVLQDGNFLVSGIAVRDGITLIWTDTAVYQFQYTGDNNVYSTSLAGKICGLIGPKAKAVMNNVAYWFSGKDFWMWNGQVQKIPSDDIRDYVVNDLDQFNSYKCCVGTNIKRNEVWFLYPSATDNAGENTRYVIYHVDQQCWSSGKTDNITIPAIAAFTAFTDRNLFDGPLIGMYTAATVTTNTTKMNDITSNSSSTYDNSYLTFSPMDISKGDRNVDIFSFLPDFQNFGIWNALATLNLSINTQQYPGDAITVNGTYSIAAANQLPNIQYTNKIDLRIGAKLIGYKIADPSVGSGSLWRLGVPRVEIQPAGARR